MKAVPPVNPFTEVPASSLATIAAAVTGIVTYAKSQLLGFNIWQIWYLIVYVPAGVPIGTDTTPVDVLRVGTNPPPIGVAGLITVIVTRARLANGVPFKVSGPLPLVDNTLPRFVFPTKPLVEGIVSSWATIGAALTGIVTTAVSQLFGFKTSQIW